MLPTPRKTDLLRSFSSSFTVTLVTTTVVLFLLLSLITRPIPGSFVRSKVRSTLREGIRSRTRIIDVRIVPDQHRVLFLLFSIFALLGNAVYIIRTRWTILSSSFLLSITHLRQLLFTPSPPPLSPPPPPPLAPARNVLRAWVTTYA